MTAEPIVCWFWSGVTLWLEFRLTFANDMCLDATPAAALFDCTVDGAPLPFTNEVWIDKHHLTLAVGPTVQPTPPPKPTIELPVFHRDLRYHFGTVYNAFGPLEVDQCV